MVHDYGPGRKFASAHAEMAAEASPLESHDTLDNIEQSFRNEDGMIVTLHYDPIVTDDPKVASMRLRIKLWLKRSIAAFRFMICAVCRAPRTPT